MRIDDLFEARRNNFPRESALESLTYYSGKNYFVSYTHDMGKDVEQNDDFIYSGLNSGSNTSGAKIGINPKSGYHTPLGIYSYPVDYVIRGNGWVPYGNDRPYLWILEPVEPMLSLDTMTDSDYSRLIEQLWHSEYNGFDLDTAFGQELLEYAEDTTGWKTPGGKFWNVTRLISRTKNLILPEDEDEIHDLLQNLDGEQHSNPVAWNALFRFLGFGGVSDTKGIIHSNEPVQAVFFTRSAFKVVNMINNRKKTDMRMLYMLNPRLFAMHVDQGKLSNYEIGDVLNNNDGAWRPFLRWESLPQSFRDYVDSNPLLWSNATFLKRAKYSPESTYRLIKSYGVRAIKNLRDIQPEVIKRFKNDPQTDQNILDAFALRNDGPF